MLKASRSTSFSSQRGVIGKPVGSFALTKNIGRLRSAANLSPGDEDLLNQGDRKIGIFIPYPPQLGPLLHLAGERSTFDAGKYRGDACQFIGNFDSFRHNLFSNLFFLDPLYYIMRYFAAKAERKPSAVNPLRLFHPTLYLDNFLPILDRKMVVRPFGWMVTL